jgi:hypothetical protein
MGQLHLKRAVCDVRCVEQEQRLIRVLALDDARDAVVEDVLLICSAVERGGGLVRVPQINNVCRLSATTSNKLIDKLRLALQVDCNST